MLVSYGALLIKVMVFKDAPMVRVGHLMLNFAGTDGGHPPNFIPFATIAPYLLGHKGLIIAGINLAGNVILLVPVGFLVPLVFRRITWKRALALSVGSGLFIELLQAALRVGIFDIDDVLLNALGAMLGFWVFLLLAKMARAMRPNTLLVAACAGILAIGSAALYGYQKFPVRLEASPVGRPDTLGAGGNDLCGGTGGNGQIASIDGSAFVMRRNNGENQAVYLAGNAEVHIPAGHGSASDLKEGDRVTLVGGPNPDGSFAADAVFVCGAPRQEAAPAQ